MESRKFLSSHYPEASTRQVGSRSTVICQNPKQLPNMPETISEEAPHASSSAGSVNSEPVDAVKTTGDKHTIGASNEYASETMKMIQHTEEHHETDGSDCSGFAIEDEIEEDEPLVEVQSKLLKRKLKLQKKGN